MNKIALTKKEKEQLKKLTKQPFSKLSKKNQKDVLHLGVKDFSVRFENIIKKLATE